MANTNIQKQVEKWICDNRLRKLYGKQFRKKRLELSWGGMYEFDAVSDDESIVINISSSPGRTVTGKYAAGKIHKIKSDTLYLINVKGPVKKIQVLKEKTMQNHFEKERDIGRYPKNVDIVHIQLPTGLQELVEQMRKVAVSEVTP